MNSRESGLSLAEALVTLALLCVFIVPAFNMLRQSAVNYSRACSAYKTDLALSSLLAETKDAVGAGGFSGIAIGFSGYEGYECVIIVEDLSVRAPLVFKYPENSSLEIAPASISPAGNFTGLITAAVRDVKTGVIKVKALPF
jgi:hypothetical protein